MASSFTHCVRSSVLSETRNSVSIARFLAPRWRATTRCVLLGSLEELVSGFLAMPGLHSVPHVASPRPPGQIAVDDPNPQVSQTEQGERLRSPAPAPRGQTYLKTFGNVPGSPGPWSVLRGGFQALRCVSLALDGKSVRSHPARSFLLNAQICTAVGLHRAARHPR